MRVLRLIYMVLLTLVGCTNTLLSQNIDADTLIRNNFPLHIGNIGFATDSMDIVVGDVPRSEKSNFSIGLYNFGEEPIIFTNGKSNRFVTLSFEPIMLMPSTGGTMNVEFDADNELSIGEFESEISIVSDDKENPYKFLNLIMNIVESSATSKYQKSFDTIPHMVFDHYNYDYGHLVRGKILYHTFIISNLGSEPLSILEIIPPKGIKVVDSPMQQIPPNEKAILRIRINTRGRVGVQHESVVVRSNDPTTPLVILGIHGSVRVFPEHKKTSVQCND